MKNYLFTSESVTEGHPDKVADLISDNVANYLINQNESYRAAIETMVSSNMVTIAGEVKTSLIDNTDSIEELVRQTVKDIGYEQENFHWNTLSFKNLIHNQSIDIAKGTGCLDMLVMKMIHLCQVQFTIAIKLPKHSQLQDAMEKSGWVQMEKRK